MNDTKHTPGPWTSEVTASNQFVTRVIRGPNDELVAHVGVPGYDLTPSVAVGVADARLISAAPDLLDALTDLVGGCGKEGDLFSSAAMGKARAAIAKATGKT